MSKRIEDMTDKDIKEYIESDEGRSALNSLYFEWTDTPQEKTLRLLKGQ